MSDPTSAGWSPSGASCTGSTPCSRSTSWKRSVLVPIVAHGVTDEAAEVMAAALKHSGIPEA